MGPTLSPFGSFWYCKVQTHHYPLLPYLLHLGQFINFFLFPSTSSWLPFSPLTLFHTTAKAKSIFFGSSRHCIWWTTPVVVCCISFVVFLAVFFCQLLFSRTTSMVSKVVLFFFVSVYFLFVLAFWCAYEHCVCYLVIRTMWAWPVVSNIFLVILQGCSFIVSGVFITCTVEMVGVMGVPEALLNTSLVFVFWLWKFPSCSAGSLIAATFPRSEVSLVWSFLKDLYYNFEIRGKKGDLEWELIVVCRRFRIYAIELLYSALAYSWMFSLFASPNVHSSLPSFFVCL